MISSHLWIFLLIPCSLEAVTVVYQHPQNEYYLEHEVVYEKAIAEAKNLTLYPGKIPGCKTCNEDEMTYCKDGRVLNDHCCCEGRSREVFPYVPHACRIYREGCQLKARDCSEYVRLFECCCHSYQAALWKYYATGSNSRNICSNALIVLAMLGWLLLLS